MKREDLFEAAGGLDEVLLDENVTQLPEKSKFRFVLPLAACLVLAAGIAAAPFVMRGLPSANTPLSPVQPDATAPTEELTVPITEQEETTEQVEQSTAYPLLPTTEEWMGRVYFGSEFPYFIYGNEDYCVFSEGMDGLFIFDFNKGEITFSANITETLDSIGIAHGADGWNGVTLCAYRENGEVKLMCVAYDGYDSAERGFAIDTDAGTMTEISNFALKDFDRIELIYNGIDAMGFLFGAAPIPLEDGYICFENSGMNDDILPGEGSHLPMLEIRKVRGDVVEKWVPFKDLTPIIKSGG